MWRFQGLWVCIIGCIQSTVGSGFSSMGWTVFVRVFINTFGWTAAMMGALGSVNRMVDMVTAPLLGWTVDRFGPRWASSTWLSFLPIGWVLMYFMTDYWQLYIIYSVCINAGLMGLMRVSWTAAVRWWVQRRAMAIGIIALGGGAGGILAPVTVMLVEVYGWRNTALWLAAISLVFCVLVGLFYPSGFPQDYGLYPDNMTPEERQRRTATRRVTAQFAELTTAQALRTRAFWYLVLGGAFAGLAGGALVLFQNIRMGAAGYSMMAAAAFYAFNRMVTYVGRIWVTLFGDWVGARMEPRFILGACYISICLGMVFFAIGTVDWHYYTWAILHGVAMGTTVPYLGYVMGAYFGSQGFGLILGLRISFSAVGGMVSPLLVGWLVDLREGDWTFPFLLLAGFYLLAAYFYTMATPPKQPTPQR